MMTDRLHRLYKFMILYLFGGFSYILIELIWRGYSHWTMFVLGGICFLAVGDLNESHPWERPLWLQMLLSAFLITALEFFCGVIVNVLLGWDVWDYSNLPLNVMGQICVPFSILWFFLSLPVIVMDDYLRWKWFGEEKPHYKIL